MGSRGVAFARTEDGMETVTVPTWWRVGAAEAGAPREVCEQEMAESEFIPFRVSRQHSQHGGWGIGSGGSLRKSVKRGCPWTSNSACV